MAVDATIGKIVVNVEARIDKLERNMRRSRGIVEKFSKSMRADVIGVMTKVNAVVGVAGAAAFYGLASSVHEATERIDKLAKTSQKLGIATEELSGLRHAANLTGVASETLDMAIQRMVRRVAEAAKDTGEAKDALIELGLNARKLNAMAPDRQFNKIAEAMSKVGEQSDRVRLAFKLFDSEGVSLVNTLKLGSQGLADAAAEAERLGLAISAKDAAKVERLSDAWDKFKKATTGGSNSLTVGIAPRAAAAFESLADAVVGLRKFSEENKSKLRFSVNSAAQLAEFSTTGRASRDVARFAVGTFDRLRRKGANAPIDQEADMRRRGASDEDIRAWRFENNRSSATEWLKDKQAFDRRQARANHGTFFTDKITSGMSGMFSGIGRGSSTIGRAAEKFDAAISKLEKPTAAGVLGAGIKARIANREQMLQQQRDEQERLAEERQKASLEAVERRLRNDMIVSGRSNGILESGSSEAFRTLRKNLRESDQKKLLDVNKEQAKWQKETAEAMQKVLTIWEDVETIG